MKKLIFCFIIIGLSNTVWGQSIGLGHSVTINFPPLSGGFENKTSFLDKNIQSMTEMQSFGISFFTSFDINFLHVFAGFHFSDGADNEVRSNSPLIKEDKAISYELYAFNLGLFGKYPFSPAPNFNIYPTAGLEYNLVCLALLNEKEEKNPFDWNQLWIKLGIGFDFFIPNSSWFFRIEHLYGIRLPTTAERRLANESKEMLETTFLNDYGFNQRFSSRVFPEFGTTLKCAVGYKF